MGTFVNGTTLAPISQSQGIVLVNLSATYDISEIGSNSSLGQAIESMGFYANEAILLSHIWHPVTWQIGNGMYGLLQFIEKRV